MNTPGFGKKTRKQPTLDDKVQAIKENEQGKLTKSEIAQKGA